MFQQKLYLALLWLSASISFSLGVYAFRRKKEAKAVNSFIISMALVTIWSAGNALELQSIQLSTKLFWANLQYIAFCFSPVSLLRLCMEYTGHDRLIENRRFWVLLIIPTITVLLVFTDSWHGLIRYDFKLNTSGLFSVIDKEYGPLFYVHSVYSHFLNITAMFVLIRGVFIKNTVYRKQAASLLIGISLIVVSNILYILKIGLMDGFDMTPILFGPAGIILAFGIFHYKLFDLVPIARATVIENMNLGYMLLDLQDRVVDSNKIFQKFIAKGPKVMHNKSAFEVCKDFPKLIELSSQKANFRDEMIVGNAFYYEITKSLVYKDNNELIGSMILLKDITSLKLAEIEFLKQQSELIIMKEQIKHASDIHDNFGQILGFINFQTYGILKALEKANVTIGVNELTKLVEITQHAHDDMRAYIRNVHELCINKKSMDALLDHIIDQFEMHSDIEVVCNCIALESVDMAVKTQNDLLNIIRESFNNIIKHANASRVEIVIDRRVEGLIVSIIDDGKGFDVDKNLKIENCKYGLANMKRRVYEMKGTLEIDSKVGVGTRIDITIPVERGGIIESHVGG